MKTALVQMDSRSNKALNVRKALEFTREAIARKAEFVVLPEYVFFRGPIKSVSDLREIVEPVRGPTVKIFADLAQEEKVWILIGSMHEEIPRKAMAYNTSILLSPNGKIAAKYRKQNLFHFKVPGREVREKDVFFAGRHMAVAPVGPFTLGMTVCFDVRFPTLFEKYARRGVNVFTVPASFGETTGRAHWKTLVRARAIETFSYVLAPDQTGINAEGARCWGHSLVVGPWGDVLAEASGHRQEIIYADLDRKMVSAARKMFPKHKKLKI